jgi:glycosyltransferase involved in cell wall biosynthesis
VWDRHEHKYAAGVADGLRLAKGEVKLLRGRREEFDAVVVGYPGHFDLPAARRAARGKPIVFNPLVSLADTFVGDRGRFEAGSLAARALRAVDRAAFRAADIVVADTRAQAELFSRLGARRVEVCFVGAEETVFHPGWRMREPFTALFVGKLIPLHGVETVLEAAQRTPEVRFRVVGSGQLEHVLRERPANVEWIPWVDYNELPGLLHGCGCALGIFGTSAKARRVIPNKVFQALACGAPVVSGDTQAMRELGEDAALLVPPGDAAELAEAVRRLSRDRPLQQELAARGHEKYQARASEAILGERWRALIADLV